MAVFLVTGAAGFIGSNFVRHILDTTGHFVLCLDKMTYAGNTENLFLEKDRGRYVFEVACISDRDKMTTFLNDYQPDIVINFAAETHVDRSITNYQPFVNTNVNGTIALLSSMLAYYQNLSVPKQQGFKFIHISTDEVYGMLDRGEPTFTELHPLAPNSPYAASKASGDHFVWAFHHTYGLPTIIVRPSNNYGPRQFPEKLIPLMIINALKEQTLPIYGSGEHIRDWLYVGDTCLALDVIISQGHVGHTYNVGGSCEKTNQEVVHTICQILDEIKPCQTRKSYRDLIQYVADRPGHDYRYGVNCSKISRLLSWAPQGAFETKLRETISWYLDHLNWVKNILDESYLTWIEENYERRKRA